MTDEGHEVPGRGVISSGPAGAWVSAAKPALFGFVIFLVLGAVVVTATWPDDLSPDTRQPIAFNHLKHVTENQLECGTCHEFYAEETYSGLPSSETCAACHSEAMGESREEQKLVKMLEEGTPLEWQRLFRQPSHVFFSHRRHVAAGSFECRDCHGLIEESQRPPERVRRLTMEKCIECHQERRVPNDCTTCHR